MSFCESMTKVGILATLVWVLAGCASGPPPPQPQARNTVDPVTVVEAHLRAVEAGDWDRAAAFLSGSYSMKMKGMPFFVHIAKNVVQTQRVRL